MTSDTARRLADEKYPKKWTNSIDMTKADGARDGFLAGWDAAIEHAARQVDGWIPDPHTPDEDCSDCAIVHDLAAAIRAKRSDR